MVPARDARESSGDGDGMYISGVIRIRRLSMHAFTIWRAAPGVDHQLASTSTEEVRLALTQGRIC